VRVGFNLEAAKGSIAQDRFGFDESSDPADAAGSSVVVTIAALEEPSSWPEWDATWLHLTRSSVSLGLCSTPLLGPPLEEPHSEFRQLPSKAMIIVGW